MSLTKLQEKIIQDATAKAAEITKSFAAQKAEREEKVRDAARKLEEDIIDQAQKEAEYISTRALQDAKMNMRSKILHDKQKQLDVLEQAFLQQLLDMPKEESKAMIEKLLKHVPKKEKGTIVAGEVSHHAVEKLCDSKEHTVAKEVIAGEGGFIFRGDKSEVDLTFTNLVRQVFLHHRSEIAHVLFR